MEALVPGPGSIAQEHTVGEWIAVAQLREAVEVYARLIGALCGSGSREAGRARSCGR